MSLESAIHLQMQFPGELQALNIATMKYFWMFMKN
jgi:hypothetical protein